MYRSTLKSNLTDQVVFVHNGVDEIRRNITMHIDDENNGGSFVDTVSSNSDVQQKSKYKELRPVIETVLLGDVLEAIHVSEKPTNIIMKMDIEGFECRAILG